MKLQVSVAKQEMLLRDGTGIPLRNYVISTSRYGLGSERDSNFTPLGTFRIVQKIGHGAPACTIFKSRQIVGLWDGSPAPEDFVLTRILWLDGQEAGNANSFARYIYIHGTNQEELLGQPASHGCIRMANDEVIDLFDRVELGTEVIIGDAPPANSLEFL